MPIDNFNGLNHNSKEIGYVIHTDEVVERGNHLFFTKSRVLSVLAEFFESNPNSDIQLELQRVQKDDEGNTVFDKPIIVGDFSTFNTNLADGNYMITASIKKVPIAKVEKGEPNTVLVTDSQGNVIWRNSDNFRAISIEDIVSEYPNSILVTNKDNETEWLRFSNPNSLLVVDEEGNLKSISSSIENSVLCIEDGKLTFKENYHPNELDISKLNAGDKNSVLLTNKDKKVEWSSINDLIDITDSTKKLDYIRSLMPYFAQVHGMYEFYIETLDDSVNIENSVNVTRNRTDGVLSFNTHTGNAILETRTFNLNRMFNKLFISPAPSYKNIVMSYSLDDGINWTDIPNEPIEFSTPRDTIKIRFSVVKSDSNPLELDFYGFFIISSLGD